MKIYILGHPCRICDTVEEIVWNVVEENEIAAKISRITRDRNIYKYGIHMTPAISINGRIKAMGRVPKKEEILTWIMKEKEREEQVNKVDTVIKLSSWIYPQVAYCLRIAVLYEFYCRSGLADYPVGGALC